MPEAQPLRLLLVEDHELVARYIVDRLVAMGVERTAIDVAETAAQALALLGQHHYRAIVMDIRLPDAVSDEDVVKRIHAAAGGSPIIAYSGADVDAAIPAIKGLIVAFVVKGGPKTWLEVEQALRPCLGDLQKATEKADAQLDKRVP